MVTSLALAIALATPAAPIRPETQPAGPAPHILDLKVGPDGKVRVTVMREVKIQNGVDVPLGRPVPAPAIEPAPVEGGEGKERTVKQPMSIEIGEIKDLTVTTVAGKEVSKGDAIKQLAEGGVVIASADGKKVHPKFLKLFRDETLVLVSPEFEGLPVQGNFYPNRIRMLPGRIGGGVAPAILPVAPPVQVPAQKLKPIAKPAIQAVPAEAQPVEKQQDTNK